MPCKLLAYPILGDASRAAWAGWGARGGLLHSAPEGAGVSSPGSNTGASRSSSAAKLSLLPSLDEAADKERLAEGEKGAAVPCHALKRLGVAFQREGMHIISVI